MLDIKLSNAVVDQVTRSDGIVILLFFTIFVYYLFSLIKNKKNNKKEKAKYNIWISLLLVGLGLTGIIFGSNMVVNNATGIAHILGISDRVIALTIVAFGTSLPELVTTIVSSRKGEQDILLGNIIGSNIFNVCVVLGIPVVIYGTITPGSFSTMDLFTFVGSALLLLSFATTKKQINRLEGILMLLIFAVYYTIVFIL